MAKVTVEVYFEGKTRMQIETDDYAHYFENDEARGGIQALARDTFYDEADLYDAPFEHGSTEFYRALFEIEGQD